MEDRFNFRIPEFTDKDKFIGFQYIELGDSIDELLTGHLGEPQQCTGLKDTNGKLVYEGDIVKDILGIIYKVSFSNISLSFVLKDEQNEVVSQIYFTPEIMGNIWENPELLEGGK